MKLFFLPSACSLAPHILLRELSLIFDLEKVPRTDKSNLLKYNSKGHVPTLVLDNGKVLTETAVIMQYIADLKPEANLIPRAGSLERYQAQEWLNYVATELHKSFNPIFTMKRFLDESHLDLFRQKVETEAGWLNDHFTGHNYLMGEQFSVADIYAYVVLSWSPHVKVDLSACANVLSFMERVENRPSVQAAKIAEAH